MTEAQLTLDGREADHPVAHSPLNDRQRDLLGWLRERESARPAEVGTLLHDWRGFCGQAHRPDVRRAVGCCAAARHDGWAALHFLHRRGLIGRIGHGQWAAVANASEDWRSPAAPTPGEAEQIVESYRRGRTLAEIAAELFRSETSILRVLHRADVKMRRPQAGKNRLDRADVDGLLKTLQLYDAGYSAAEVGKLLGIHPGTVLYRVRRYSRNGPRHGYDKNRIPAQRRAAAGSRAA